MLGGVCCGGFAGADLAGSDLIDPVHWIRFLWFGWLRFPEVGLLSKVYWFGLTGLVFIGKFCWI